MSGPVVGIESLEYVIKLSGLYIRVSGLGDLEARVHGIGFRV